MKHILGYALVCYPNCKGEKKYITFESKSDYAIIENYRGLITLTRNAQKKLYLILKNKFEKSKSRRE